MAKTRISADEVTSKIEGIRRVNAEVGFASLNFRENVVQEEIRVLAEKLGTDGWKIRNAVLGPRPASTVAAELEALTCVP